MHNTAASAVANYGDIQVYKDLEELTNIHVEFIHPAKGIEKESFNLLVASKDIPDIVEGGWERYYSGGMNKAYEDGFIVALNDYLDQYAPNYKKNITSNEAIEKLAKNDDNKILGFYLIRPKPYSGQGFIFRKDLMS